MIGLALLGRANLTDQIVLDFLRLTELKIRNVRQELLEDFGIGRDINEIVPQSIAVIFDLTDATVAPFDHEDAGIDRREVELLNDLIVDGHRRP
jgi:hypothetical protein